MIQIYPDLWQTRLEKPFGGVHAHAYFLQSQEGNILIYNTGHAEEIDDIADKGGVKYQLLSHRDETGDSLKVIKQQFGSELLCHETEEPAIAPSCIPDITFSEKETKIAGVEIFHTPGHTEGSISFLYESPLSQRYLFTGDTLFQSHGEWQTLVFPAAGGSIHALRESLLIYRELKPDVVLWSASGGGDNSYIEVSDLQWKEIISATLNKLEG